jgi:hypothetical protein
LLKEKNQQKDENSPNLITLSRVARFLLTYVMYGNGGKYTKLPLHILPNGHRVYQPFSFRGPNWDFWFENIPSGNPDLEWDIVAIV